MELLKVHGSGNDFYMLDAQKMDKQLSESELRQLAINICDRDNGLIDGADGLLFVDKADHEGPLGRMRVINADGSEASMCGNGLRSVARYLAEENRQQSFSVQTMEADLPVAKMPDLAEGVATYQAHIAPVSFKAEDLKMHVNDGADTLVDQAIAELDTNLKFTAVAVPNPHLIAFVDQDTLESDELGELGRYLNNGNNPVFPDGVNVSFVRIIGQNNIFVRTFERGVGYTNACGTAMSASSLVSVLLHSDEVANNAEITVQNPGGIVKTRVHHQIAGGEDYIDLIGNATFVRTVNLSLEDALNGDFSHAVKEETDEQKSYEDFVAGLQLQQ
ncbi:diaminopimelate epimerase [Paucilactobacillus suebicus]|uniref:Diaminopimelate epimerase n=1 Tax=Paucilactobacillus suebicus DSM 5007 = KCTC 3549 TaxID=1423807 RepID=A0A0R1WC83_9LACO|nr:diaminopimelate epimerase [Paucilactobacillus suebicus]KRM12550.1 diaminopimelate epimerase [Paucilactobacillus suebicus DSM 5007 = KCTC 3549]